MESVPNICLYSNVQGGVFGQSDSQRLMCWKGKALRHLYLQRGFFPLPLQSGLGQRDSSLINTRRISTEQNPSELTELWFT